MLRLSDGLRNALNNGLGFQGAFNRGFMQIYTGAQPASANDSVGSSVLLGVASAAGLTPTYETPAAGSVTLTGGASGSINTVTVGGFNIIPDGAVPFNTSLNQTASDLCDAINRNGIYQATVSGAVVSLRPRPGTGAAHNGYAVTASLTTITASYANMASGVAPANGLILLPSAAGKSIKPIPQTWSFLGLAVGTAAWFRFIQSYGDAGLADPTAVRLDGTLAVSGADASMANTSVSVGLPNTIDRFEWLQLAQ